MFIINVYSNGEVGLEDYVNGCNLNFYEDYINRIELITECINRFEYERNYLKERVNNNDIS